MAKKIELEQIKKNKVKIKDTKKSKRDKHVGKKITPAIRGEMVDLLLYERGWIDAEGKVL
jgi:hypothetical protein